ncbi:uncharacterized protein LOC143213359 isoform X2 [Lasioglossum baleicum]|uniref:uncharacterized protein LOC143213359 isoform X2 n=1 Tax=Lasioglossum baleicum TaxID=434251 RepID=UPI003FCC93D7
MQKNKAKLSFLTNCNSVNPTVGRASVKIPQMTETEANHSPGNSSENVAKQTMSKIQGFQTASGKNMNITEKALMKAKALFSDETFESCDGEPVLSKSLQKRKVTAELKMFKVQGFQTASGTNMNITEEALLKAKTLFSDEDLESYNRDSSLTKSVQKDKDSAKFKISKMQGFQTASGKDMNITEEALLKAKSLFSNEDFESYDSNTLLTKSLQKDKDSVTFKLPKMQGFQTASGKNMNITEEALLKAKSLFSNEDLESYDSDTLLTKPLQKDKDSAKYKIPKMQGFQTASGKDMKISEEALLRTEILFSDEILESCDYVPCSPLLNESLYKRKGTVQLKVPNVQGFQTARGKNIEITEAALSKAGALLTDETLESFDNMPSSSLLDGPMQKCKDSGKFEMPKMQELQIAGTKDMNTTQEVLREAEALFSDETLDNYVIGPLLNKSQQKHKDSTKFEMFKMQGFQMASGKDMNVTEEAFLKAKTLFFNGDLESYDSDPLLTKSLQKNKDSAKFKISKRQGFQTASGKDLEITEEALMEAEALFSEQTMENCDINHSLNKSQQKHKDPDKFEMPKMQGFQTASGKNMNITEEALLKAKSLFTNEDLESYNSDTLLTKSLQKDKDSAKFKISKMQGFQTASGKDMNITEEALLKAKSLFTNEDFESYDSDTLLTKSLQKGKDFDDFKISEIQGFQTASGKEMKITEEALLKAKTLFSDQTLEACDNESLLKHEDFKVQRLQTASGKNTNITGEALFNAKALLSEEDMEICDSSPSLSKSLPKRKINDLDDASMNRETMSNQLKKLRFSNEFQAQENVCNYSNINNKRGNQEIPLVSSVPLPLDKIKDTDELVDANKQDIDMEINSLICNEIVESAAALLEDENSSEMFNQWTSSPATTIENNGATDMPLSPVIGGQFVIKKRKSAGTRRKSTNAAESKKNKITCTDSIKQLSNKCMNSDGEKENSLLNQESMNNEKRCKGIVNDYGDTQLMLDFIDETAGILEKRMQSALDQEEQVKLKGKCKPKPTIGILYSHRKINHNNRTSWREIIKGGAPILCTYQELIQRKLPPEILDVTADNAVKYKFRCSDFYGFVQNNIEGIHLEDGACLILDENGYVGIPEIKRSFLASPGVDPNLLPNGWLENHYRWIVWKFASIDRIKFASVVLPRALTPARVMMELKYRYDREIDRSQRPALRKILEKDDVASKRMILCVSSITEYNNPVDSTVNSIDLKNPSKKLTLTDGWYSVQATIDHAMIENITRGKVKVGTKLITYGSELLHCDQGYSPLEVPENVCLKIHTNATRRARWDTKLGYARPSTPLCTKLKCICPYGGLIGKIKVVVARVYPILYHEKTSSGESIFRNTRCEEKANAAYEKQCRSLTEAFYEDAEKYFCTERRRSSSTTDSIDLAAMEWTKDREKLSEGKFLSKQEQQQFINKCRIKEETIRQQLKSRLSESLPPQRRVTAVLKIRIVEEETSAILSIWTPNEEVTDILKEGNCITVCNVTPSMKRGNELQLTAGWNTLFNRMNTSDKFYPQRTCTPLCDINKPNYAPAYGELDTVGIVVYIVNEPYGMKNFQAAYLACPYTEFQSFYLSVLFWNGISAFGYAEILTIGSFIACSNLEWRRATSWSIPMTYCTDRSTFTQNPKQNHLHGPFDELKRLVTDTSSYVSKCAAEISEEAQKRPTRYSDQFTPDKDHLNKMLFNKNCNSSLQEISERSLLNNSAKSVAIQKRLDRLQCYGEASSLSPIVLNRSRRVSLNFKSHVRTSDGKQSKAQVSLNAEFSANSR